MFDVIVNLRHHCRIQIARAHLKESHNIHHVDNNHYGNYLDRMASLKKAEK